MASVMIAVIIFWPLTHCCAVLLAFIVAHGRSYSFLSVQNNYVNWFWMSVWFGCLHPAGISSSE